MFGDSISLCAALTATELLPQPFLDQLAKIRSIAAVGCGELFGRSGKELPGASLAGGRQDAVLLRLGEDGGGSPLLPAHYQGGRPIDSLARQARELCEGAPGDDLLVLPAHLLEKWMTPPGRDLGFRAVAALWPENPATIGNPVEWKLRRSLFERGLICIASVRIAGWKALCFLASDAVCSFNHLHDDSRGLVSMSVFLMGAAFGNQLFRYACLKLYAIRHGLTPALPAWEGNRFFGLEDRSCEGLALPQVVYPGFAENDREIWDHEEPPINIDLAGYFQEFPKCWRRHRPLLRRMFQHAPAHVAAMDAWKDTVTKGGQRTLVAIHVRRGDYRTSQNLPQFRLVPEDWYLEWLRAIWPTLAHPVLFVGTDERDEILPRFQEFETVSTAFIAGAQDLPDHIRDFEALRRADYLAICNSSFSRMAAILAASSQKCFLPSFIRKSFAPYEPWMDPGFWVRFGDSGAGADVAHKPQEQIAPAMNGEIACEAPAKTTTIFVDVSDLLSYLLRHATFSGIQRVETEILRNLVSIEQRQRVRFVVLNKRGELGEIETAALVSVIDDIRSGITPKADIESKLRDLAGRVIPCRISPGEIFLALGAFWNTSGMGLMVQHLKNSGAIIGIFIHDILPVMAPEFFNSRDARVFAKGVTEALTFADFLLTTTEYNKTTLAGHLASRKSGPIPIHVVPLGRGLCSPAPTELQISSVVADLLKTDYVLCVGTIEVRKNPVYLFNVWKMMIKSGRGNIPRLVFAGRKGWLVQDFFDQLKACNYLGGRIVAVHDATDLELDLLYKKCLLTMFPSFGEGWGLPVGECLAHGKICLCSELGGIPEASGKLADYIDPYNTWDGLEKLSRYLDDPELRRSREREIVEGFQARSWVSVAEDVLQAVQSMARPTRPFEGVAAIKLPRDRYLEITNEAVARPVDPFDGALSAELICISGWHTPEKSGVRAAQAAATIRFRADARAGTRINLVMRVAAFGRDFRIRICSGSGSETESSIASGAERLVVLPCQIEPGELLTVQFLSVGSLLDEEECPGASYWALKGVLYFDPKRISQGALRELKREGAAPFAQTGAPARPPSPLNEESEAAESTTAGHRILLRGVSMDENRRSGSFGEFLETTDTYWLSSDTSDRGAPIFADHADRGAFYAGLRRGNHGFKIGKSNDCVKFVRRADQCVSMSRFSEGSVFDRLGVWKSFELLQSAPPGSTSWLSGKADGVWIGEEPLWEAPYYEGSYLVFYDGNLHNYYHWLVEGLLSLDILSQALGKGQNLKIALPKSIEKVTRFDYRESLRAVDVDIDRVELVPSDLIKVREAIWVDSEGIQGMPARYLKDFQRRIAALYKGARGPRNRKLLLARQEADIHNLEQVRTFLSRYRFETVNIEGMSMRDQILLFQSAELIISPRCAGLANLIFCEPGTKVIELMPSAQVRPSFWVMAEKLDLVHALQFCASNSDHSIQGALNVDVAKLQALIRMTGAHL